MYRLTGPAVLVAMVALLAVPGGAAAASKPPSLKRQVNLAFKQLARDTRHLPRKAIKTKDRKFLVATVNRARRQARRNPCKSIKTLAQFRRALRRIHEPGLKSFEPIGTTLRGSLEDDQLGAAVALMQLPGARRCGGGHKATVTQSAPRVLQSDEKHLRLRISLPAPTFGSQKVGGTIYQQMFMGGMGETGNIGSPGLPQTTQFYGVPLGADISMTVNGTQGYDLHGVNLFPHQKSAVDLPPLPAGAPGPSTFANPPFEKDAKTYGSNAKFPAKPADAAGVGDVRGLRVGGVDFSGGQYKPKTDTLHVYTSIDVTVTFGGANTGKFGKASDFQNQWNSWFQQNYKSLVDNYDTVVGNLDPGVIPQFCGEEMLVITSPDLKPAADAFAAAKAGQGYFARVKIVGSGPGQIGTTNTQIQTYIRGELNADCAVRPQYVVLLGNTAAVPTFLVPCSPSGFDPDPAKYCDIASDLPYSLDGNGSDLFADVMLGRIPATDLPGAMAVVNKIVNYENTMPAPAGDDFYHHATATGYFQPSTPCFLNAGETGTPNCDSNNPPVTGHYDIDYTNHRDTRGFTKTSDAVISAMQAQSYNVDRLWTTDNSNVTPEQYWDGTNIPSNLRRPAFAWDANTTDFLNAYNGGRFLIFHRDHGWPDGWAAPDLTSGHVPGLTNGTKLPVVFGVNCASAAFDTPAHPSFVELQVEKPDGGAVAGFGDTRNSPSFPNNHMALGFFDALFPDLVPTFGSATPSRRLGDVLLSGKAYMASQEGIDWQGAGDTYVEHYLYHLLGDPSMQMWAAPPMHFEPPRIDSKYRQIAPVKPGDPVFQVEVTFPTGNGEPFAPGTVATLFHDGDPIGRGIVGADGKVTITPQVTTDANKLTVAFQQDGVLPAQDTVDQGSPAQPTTLTFAAPKTVGIGSPNTFTGHLDPGFGPTPVTIVYTRDSNGETVNHSVTTANNGDFTDNITFTKAQAGRWHAQASYGGDLGHGASSSTVVQFTVRG
jgi:hypothetical protein